MSCTPEIITDFVEEESSISIGIAITGLDDEALTPNTFEWTLTDVDGNIINSRVFTAQTPAATNWVDLEGDDLVLPGTSGVRVVTTKGTMNTTRDGVPLINKPYTKEKRFEICKVLNIPEIVI